MNSLERTLAAIRFEPADRTPFMPQIFGLAARTAGIGLDAYIRDGRLIAECQLRLRERIGSDAVIAFSDLGVETEALGSRLKYSNLQYPEVVDYVLAPSGDPATLRLPDPARDGRMPAILNALELMRRSLGDSALVVGGIAGPMTLAAQLYGAEAALYLTADDWPRFEAALDFAVEVAIHYSSAQIAAGAHMVMVLDPMASPDVVPPKFFRERLLPRLRKVMASQRTAGALITWLNIAGPTAPILPHYAEIGADLATFDYYVDPTEARSLLPRTCLAGNLKTLDFLAPSPEGLAAQARRLIAAFADRGGFILSSGCEIPPEAGENNVAALAEAVARG